MSVLASDLGRFIENAWNLRTAEEYSAWIRHVVAYLDVAMGDASRTIEKLGGPSPTIHWQKYRDSQVGHLQGHLARIAIAADEQERGVQRAVARATNTPPITDGVFLVHGHDTSAKETVARYLEKLGLNVVILHEQPSEGRTIIEKFEAHSGVGYAVVLLTPDDVGAAAVSPDVLTPRARQNVILELGYFTGKLGRSRICGLFKPGLELPSDMHGVLFIELDGQGGWRPKLAQELVRAGMKIELKALLGG